MSTLVAYNTSCVISSSRGICFLLILVFCLPYFFNVLHFSLLLCSSIGSHYSSCPFPSSSPPTEAALWKSYTYELVPSRLFTTHSSFSHKPCHSPYRSPINFGIPAPNLGFFRRGFRAKCRRSACTPGDAQHIQNTHHNSHGHPRRH